MLCPKIYTEEPNGHGSCPLGVYILVRVELPDLANKKYKLSNLFEFQIMNDFLVNVCPMQYMRIYSKKLSLPE